MLHIIGLVLMSVWSLGYLTPYTIIGFTEILLLTFLLNYLLSKIEKLNLLMIRIYKKLGFINY